MYLNVLIQLFYFQYLQSITFSIKLVLLIELIIHFCSFHLSFSKLSYLGGHVDCEEAVDFAVQFGEGVFHHGGFPGSHGTDHHHGVEGADKGGDEVLVPHSVHGGDYQFEEGHTATKTFI